MTIRHTNDGSITVLTGRLADQFALVDILNRLYDRDCPILSVEYMGANETGNEKHLWCFQLERCVALLIERHVDPPGMDSF